MELCKLLIIFSAILLLLAILAESHEVEDDEREFGYEKGTEKGPEKWGKINEDWSACSHGRMQSPVDLTRRRVRQLRHLPPLRRSYRPGNAVLKNRSHDIMLQWEEEVGGIWINRTEYSLKQLHWHWPSEHTINGRRYSLELHMVHESKEKKIAVFAILYKNGRPDSFLAKMEKSIKKIKDIGEGEEKVGEVDPRDVKKGSRKYYRYMGSLTTPPCTEGVTWTIIHKVRTVSRKQMRLLREAVHGDVDMNARPIQHINDRIIGLYRPQRFLY